jgi:hypothetical protein
VPPEHKVGGSNPSGRATILAYKHWRFRGFSHLGMWLGKSHTLGTRMAVSVNVYVMIFWTFKMGERVFPQNVYGRLDRLLVCNPLA